MTKEEYIESVRAKLNECEPLDGELYDDSSLIEAVFNDAYTRCITTLINTTGAYFRIHSSTAKVDNGFKTDVEKPVLSFQIPKDFLRMEIINGTGFSRPITTFKDNTFIPEESDVFSRSGEYSPVSFLIGDKIVLMAGNHPEISMSYIPSLGISEIDNATRNERIRYILCCYAAALVRTQQGGNGDFWFKKAEEML